MAGKSIRNWFRRQPAASPAVQAALEELGRLKAARPALAALIDLFQELLPRLFEQPAGEALPPLARDRAATKLASGVPLLRGESIALELPAFRRRWDHVCAAVKAQRTDQAAQLLAEAGRTVRLDPERLLQAVLDGRPEEVRDRASRLDLDVELTGTVLRLTLFPVLSHLGVELEPVRAGIVWGHGYCPVCGSWPLLGEFRGLEQTRHLRCELCASSWEHARLACPFCGTRDHAALGFLHIEGEESSRRAATCDVCRGYVKTLATLSKLSPLQLLVADLSTTDLDLAAAERGYQRPPSRPDGV